MDIAVTQVMTLLSGVATLIQDTPWMLLSVAVGITAGVTAIVIDIINLRR